MNWVSFGSRNGLPPLRRQAIIWTYVGLFSILLPGTIFSEIRLEILLYSSKKVHLKLPSAKMAAIFSNGDELNKRCFIQTFLSFLYGWAVYVKAITLTLSQWSFSGNPVAIQCAWNSDPSVHWDATGEMPVCFQWCSSGLPVAFQWSSSVFQLCKLTLDRHWDTTGC